MPKTKSSKRSWKPGKLKLPSGKRTTPTKKKANKRIRRRTPANRRDKKPRAMARRKRRNPLTIRKERAKRPKTKRKWRRKQRPTNQKENLSPKANEI